MHLPSLQPHFHFIDRQTDLVMEEHSLTCTICLDRFKCPVTIPCGHTFCQECISKHWDQMERGGSQNTLFNCPVCKKTFSPRPTLNRNVSLSVLSEVAASSAAERVAGAACRIDRVEDGSEELCPRHQKPLIFYCRSDHMCVCYVCSVKECKDHDKVLVEEERSNREVRTPSAFVSTGNAVFLEVEHCWLGHTLETTEE